MVNAIPEELARLNWGLLTTGGDPFQNAVFLGLNLPQLTEILGDTPGWQDSSFLPTLPQNNPWHLWIAAYSWMCDVESFPEVQWMQMKKEEVDGILLLVHQWMQHRFHYEKNMLHLMALLGMDLPPTEMIVNHLWIVWKDRVGNTPLGLAQARQTM